MARDFSLYGMVGRTMQRRAFLALMSSPGSDASIWRTTFLEDIEHADHRLIVAEGAGEVIGYGRVMRFVPEADAPADTAPPGYYLMG